MLSDTPLRPRGFTLLELVFALGLMALVAGLAAPGFTSLRRSAAVSATSNQLLAALYFAQSAAARANLPTSLCLSADLLHCITTSGAPAPGWLVFFDIDRKSPVQLSANDDRLSTGQLPTGIAISGTRSAVTFWPTARAGTTATFSVCDMRDPSSGRTVVVSQTGRPRVTPSAAAVCAH